MFFKKRRKRFVDGIVERIKKAIQASQKHLRQEIKKDTHESLEKAMGEMKTWNKAVHAAIGKPFPIYVLSDLTLSARPERGAAPHKGIIVSIPKSGTYLLEKVVSEIGYQSTRLHLFSQSFTDYRFASPQQQKNPPPELTIPMALEQSLTFIQPGQFAVSHLGCTEHVKKQLSNYKTIHIYRNMRDCFVSWFRFQIDTERCGAELAAMLRNTPEKPDRILQYVQAREEGVRSFAFKAKNVSAWYNEDNVCKLSYENLNGDYGQARQFHALDSLCDFLGASRIEEKEAFLGHVLNTDTLTWSGKRTQWEEYWNDDVEKIFQDIGLFEINKLYGYEL